MSSSRWRHAGCEAALACATMGHETLLCTISLDHIALLPCNPSIGGPAKAHLVRELDALGGAMGEVADECLIQMRVLNTSRRDRRPFAARADG